MASANATPDSGEAFSTTQWSIVLAAGQNEDPARADAALESLCRAYWRPLFAYARRRGHTAPDAQDLVQGFFARILRRRDFSAVRRERGRFRSYLLTAFKHFLVNAQEYASAEKRGGGEVPIPLDALLAAEPDIQVPLDEHSPDRIFDQQWALTVINRVLAQLRDEYREAKREPIFACLQGHLTEPFAARSHAEIGAELGLKEGAVRQALFRLRQRFQTLLRRVVAETVINLGEVDAELRDLISALRG